MSTEIDYKQFLQYNQQTVDRNLFDCYFKYNIQQEYFNLKHLLIKFTVIVCVASKSVH